MGHGASTNVKKLTINQGIKINDTPTPGAKHAKQSRNSEEQARAGSAGSPGEYSPTKLGWTRSSSDGCIVENLNTSKTKAELLEQQVDEYKELFHHAEQKAETAEARAKLLEQQMAEVEGANFELLDRISGLEQQFEELKDQTSPEVEREYSQNIIDQNQTIEKQEQQIKSLEEDLAKMRIKLKKKLRSAQTELAEARQESGLKMYSLKDEIGKLQEENAKLIERLDRAHAVSGAQSRQNSAAAARNHIIVDTPEDDVEDDADDWEDGRTKVILELSSQLSAQDQRICELEEAMKEKDQMISALQKRGNARPPSGSRGKQGSAGRRRTVVESLDDENEQPSSGRQRQSSASSSKGRESHRSSSGSVRERTISSGKQRQIRDELTYADDEGTTSSNQEIRTVRSAGSSSSGKVRQQSASSLDSAISDHSDSGSTKVSSTSSSRQRRRLRKQLSMEGASETTEPSTASSKHYSDIRIEGRDSGFGVANDRSKYIDELDQMMQDIVGNS